MFEFIVAFVPITPIFLFSFLADRSLIIGSITLNIGIELILF